MWLSSFGYTEVTLGMDIMGPTSLSINVQGHYGVYEGDGYISDLYIYRWRKLCTYNKITKYKKYKKP